MEAAKLPSEDLFGFWINNSTSFALKLVLQYCYAVLLSYLSYIEGVLSTVKNDIEQRWIKSSRAFSLNKEKSQV